jgi:F-type H+-transporting ATPase subunit gamma
MESLRVIRRRIRSIESTQKIFKAMETVSAAKLRRAQARAHAAHPYAAKITEMLQNLAGAASELEHPLFKARDVKRTALVVVTADRGLCGAYNSSVIRAAEGSMKEQAELGRDYALFIVGRKAEGYFRYRNFRIDQSFTGFSDRPSYEDARKIGRAVTAAFVAEEVDMVELVYTRFVSAGSQEVVRRPLVPLEREVMAGGDGRPEEHQDGTVGAAYEFEPGPDSILDALLPRYIEARIYAALLNAAASEHAARQRAMKAATDNADELIRALSRVMNRARQEQITTEIMEIVGGAEALQSDGDEGDEHERFDFGGVRAALTASHTSH